MEREIPVLSSSARIALLGCDFRPGSPLHRSTDPAVVTELRKSLLVSSNMRLTGYGARVRARIIDEALDDMERRAES